MELYRYINSQLKKFSVKMLCFNYLYFLSVMEDYENLLMAPALLGRGR